MDYLKQEALCDALGEFFEANHEEFLRGENIKPERRLHARPDLNAFLLLDRLVPGTFDMVSAIGSYEFYLGVKPYEVMEVASPEDLLDLIRSGISYESGTESFYKFT